MNANTFLERDIESIFFQNGIVATASVNENDLLTISVYHSEETSDDERIGDDVELAIFDIETVLENFGCNLEFVNQEMYKDYDVLTYEFVSN